MPHMRVPIRKSEKYTHLPVDPHMTREKFDALTAKLARMEKSRPALAKDVQRFAENGDFSENAEYQIAKGKLRGLNRRIDETRDLINRAVIIEPGKNTGTVELGSTVTVQTGAEEKTYTILGSSETNPAKGIISHNSPIGKALIGKRAGESVAVRAGGKETAYTILAVI